MQRVVKSGKRSSKKRVLGALTMGSTGLLSSVAFAATGSLALVTIIGSNDTSQMKWLQQIMAVVFTSTFASTTTTLPKAATSTQIATVTTPVTSKPAASRAWQGRSFA